MPLPLTKDIEYIANLKAPLAALLLVVSATIVMMIVVVMVTLMIIMIVMVIIVVMLVRIVLRCAWHGAIVVDRTRRNRGAHKTDNLFQFATVEPHALAALTHVQLHPPAL